MRNLLIVGAGGFLGSVMRYLLSGWCQALSGSGTFPYGTLGVNAVGCLAIGFLGGLSENIDVFGRDVRLFLFLGLLGGFTTFSTFGYETMALLRDGQVVSAGINILAQVVLGLAAVWIGYGLSTLL
ncbi:MAG: fluoride efflux transporter CrcB [Kiritimatiellae bacterium]|nr:fluoride efflux transporter CrcB [Kiritimatiellia bacterium]